MSKIKRALRALFTKPSAVLLARVELEEAQRQLLQAQTAREYAASMETYHGKRIERLTKYLQEAHKEGGHE
jgi:hypothetical protein